MLVDLIGEGDPLIAMTHLTHRILKTIELDDDAVRITAAAYSLAMSTRCPAALDVHVAQHFSRVVNVCRAWSWFLRQLLPHRDTAPLIQ